MVEVTTPRNTYAGNGVTTAFAIPWYFLVDADIKVKIINNTTLVETDKALTTHFTLTGAGVEAGGQLTMLVAPAAGETLLIYRDPAATQGNDFKNNEKRPGATLEESVDKLTMLVQRLMDRASRLVGFGDGYLGTESQQLPTNPKAGAILQRNDSNTGWQFGPTVAEIAYSATVSVQVTGTRAVPQAITAAGGIAFNGSVPFNTWFVVGSGGPIIVTAAARIAAGTVLGQELDIIGTSDANYVDLQDGNGLVTGGQTIRLGNNSVATFKWDGANWILKSTNGLIP